MTDLHDSHRWGERDYDGDTLAYCLICRVEGFSDEPAAFAPCPGPPTPKATPTPKAKSTDLCWRTYESTYLPGHTHLCELAPHDGYHVCAECGRYFGRL